MHPNHLTTVRLGVGLAAAAAFAQGGYAWSNIGAVLLVMSNFLDHTDGELARLSGRSSRFGHWYDLLSDALTTTLFFIAIGVGMQSSMESLWGLAPAIVGAVAGCAVSLIFYLRMRAEETLGKEATQQAALGGFETEDVLYLIPLVTLCNGLRPFLILAAVCAPLFAIGEIIRFRRVQRRDRRLPAARLAD